MAPRIVNQALLHHGDCSPVLAQTHIASGHCDDAERGAALHVIPFSAAAVSCQMALAEVAREPAPRFASVAIAGASPTRRTRSLNRGSVRNGSSMGSTRIDASRPRRSV